MITEKGTYTPYDGNKPYIFVSYSHTEREKVENIIGLMFRNGVRVWYDADIHAGENWNNKIIRKIKGSKMFLCFLANGVEQRKVILDEIRLAIKMNKADKTYKIVFVFLEKMPVSISLGVFSTLIIYLISIPLGVRKAQKDGTKFDVWTSWFVIIGYAIPSFLFAIFL